MFTLSGFFCCYNNSCNGSLALCAAEMSAFEINGEGMSVHNDVCGSATLYGEGNCMVLPTI